MKNNVFKSYSPWLKLGLITTGLILLTIPVTAQNEKDTRAEQLRDPDHFLVEPQIPQNRKVWEDKAAIIKERLLLFSGLWPKPQKNDLNPVIFDEKSGRGFRVSKVYFESLPGFFVTGNLYRPDHNRGPFPAILTPHGHSVFGRLNNDRNFSIPGRCIDFARQGYVVLSIDMVGYNDSLQLPHDGLKRLSQLKGDQPVPYEHRLSRDEFIFPIAQLYGLSLGGLQLWNGIRSIDFLTGLDYVDPERIGVTGCSGGGTQTTWLMVADDRVKVAAPVNIIGTHKHPGCLCENIPGLWIEMSMPELAAAFAPRPLILVSATEDPWTNQTPIREFPLIRSHYKLMNAEGSIRNFHTAGGHNYNPESRKAVYEWMGQHLSPGTKVIDPVPGYAKEAAELGDLRVFPDHILPENAKNGREIIQAWIESAQKLTETSFPGSANDYSKWSRDLRRRLTRLLSVDVPKPEDLRYQVESEETIGDVTHRTEMIGRKNHGDRIELESIGKDEDPSGLILLVYPENLGPLTGSNDRYVRPWIRAQVDRGVRVYRVRGYASGRLQIPAKAYDSWLRSDSYNRSNQLNGIQDIVTAISSIREAYPNEPLMVAGLGWSGLLTLFATAIQGDADRVVIDFNRKDPSYDGELIKLLPVTSIRKIGDIRTALLLLAEKKSTVFNYAGTFDTGWYHTKLSALGLDKNTEFLSDETSISFLNLK